MTKKSNWLIFNFDLEEDLFAVLADRIPELSGLGGKVLSLDELPAGMHSTAENGFDVMILFQRRLYAGPAEVSAGLAALGRLEQTLQARQIKQIIGRVVFVDCSEMPNAPLSDFGLIGQYLEAVTDALPTTPFGGVFALDADRGPSDGWTDGTFRWWDTSTDAFVDHMRDYLIEALQLFNPTDDRKQG